MGTLAAAYDIVVHYNANKIRIPNMRCEIPEKNCTMDVNDDYLNNKTVGVEVDISDDEYEDSSFDSSWRYNMHSDNKDEVVLDRASNDDSEVSDTKFSDFEDNEAEIMVLDSESFPLLRWKNERSRVIAICGIEGCQWRIHAPLVDDNITFRIKSYQSLHTCVMDKHCAKATSDWMAKKLVGVMRDHPNMTSKGVEAELRKYGLKPSKMQIFRAKNKALAEIEGTYAESYSKLPKYVELLRNNNPNSICKIHYDRPNLLVEPKFLRIFISFRAQKLGFLEGCRPFVRFDGCFLKGPFGGVLLTAVSLDANNNIFPIAFAVTECENKDT
nr:uncharacterized protein LOC113693372 [Coffea arabica]